MQYVRDHYKVPAKRGARVRYTGDASGQVFDGTITSANGARIMIRFDSDHWPKRSVPAHPTWEIEYLEPVP